MVHKVDFLIDNIIVHCANQSDQTDNWTEGERDFCECHKNSNNFYSRRQSYKINFVLIRLDQTTVLLLCIKLKHSTVEEFKANLNVFKTNFLLSECR